MDDHVLEIDTQPSTQDIQRLKDGLGEHAQDMLADSGFHPVAVFARDDAGQIVGGVSGTINWSWLAISLLWVRPDQRGRGLGRRLMETIEEHGRANGCTDAHVDTLGFQAPAFYRPLGYEPFATLSDYAAEHPRIYFKKHLESPSSSCRTLDR